LLNAGSSSLKFSLLSSSDGSILAEGQADWAGAEAHYEFVNGSAVTHENIAWRGHAAAVERAMTDLAAAFPGLQNQTGELAGVGHRIVHGGDFTQAVRVDDDVLTRLDAISSLAPLHNPPSLAVLRRAQELLPAAPHVACFDTTFHARLLPQCREYAVPVAWARDWGVRRYGFHGLSHAYCTRRAAQLLGRPVEDLRLVICHLGHGCSAAAVRGGHSVDTSMGFTPLEGLMMAARSGSIDAGAILHVQQEHHLEPAQVLNTLNRNSGLLGVTQLSADMREVIAAEAEGHPRASLALAMYVHRLQQTIGGYAVTLEGLDAVVFTGGVGEHAPLIRERTCRPLHILGLRLDETLNEQGGRDRDISAQDAAVRTLVVTAREDLTMLREVCQTLGLSEPGA
jgi:acetate kinase